MEVFGGRFGIFSSVMFLSIVCAASSGFSKNNSAVPSATEVRAGATNQELKPKFSKREIVDARYGSGERERLLSLAYGLSENLAKEVFGQDAAIAVMQAKLVQYLEGFPNRTGEPVMMNMIGLPGVGKSAILEYLKRKKFPVLEFDSQKYANSEKESFDTDLFYALMSKTHRPDGEVSAPLIVIVEELDKAAEKGATIPNGGEKTSKLIGTMNMISSEGKVAMGYGGGRTVPVSNIMFLTTMNIAPSVFEAFSKAVLTEPKSYYDFTIEDFVKFDEWIRNQSSSRYKILEQVFRSNTVGRFGANSTIMRPLGSDSYRKIIELQIQRAIRQNTQEKNSDKRVTVDVHPSVVDFLSKKVVYAPSGARETVAFSNALVEQLINFGVKATGPGVTTTDRPRHIEIRYHEESDRMFVRVTEFVRKQGQAGLHPGGAIAFEAKYAPGEKIFISQGEVSAVKPATPSYVSNAERRVTKKEIAAARFPVDSHRTKDLKSTLSNFLFGQSEAIDTLVNDLKNYFGRLAPAKKEPSMRAFAGFPGIGKSEIFIQAAKALDLPVARINMQQYGSDSDETVTSFLNALADAKGQAEYESKDGRYLLLFEELDKVFEMDQMGHFVNRPIMAIVKDLLNDGIVKVPDGPEINVRNSFVGITMNFAVDRFGFEADPRLTTIEDVISAWKRLKMTPAAVKEILGAMFLPDTVSRLMTQLTIMKPLDQAAYSKIVATQTEKVTRTRLLDSDGRNVGQIEVRTTPAYRKYIFSESVIPSEGARNTTKQANAMISTDLEYALARLPKNSKYATAPLVVTLDFSEAKSAVRFAVQVKDEAVKSEKPLRLEDRRVALNFPPTSVRGLVSEERMHVTAHEFGHAFTGARLGARFEHVVVVSPSPGTGGYVKPNGNGDSVGDYIARLYMLLGSRAFERMVFSENPLSAESILRITSGPSADIQMATVTLYNMLYELGMNPGGGTVDRNFMKGPVKYAAYQEMPNELAEKLGLVLRDLEDEIIRETLTEHPRDWYVEKIAKLATAGSMTEKEFYSLIERELPEANKKSVGATNAYFRSLFAKYLKKPGATETKVAEARVGKLGLTVGEQAERSIATFSRIVEGRLGAPAKPARTIRTCSDLFQITL